MAALETKWKQLFPYTPFNVGYQNEMLREAVEASDNVATSMAGFAGVAVFLSITGLFSLVSLNVLRRMREVAVRRVLGTSTAVGWVLNKSSRLDLSLCRGAGLHRRPLWPAPDGQHFQDKHWRTTRRICLELARRTGRGGGYDWLETLADVAGATRRRCCAESKYTLLNTET